MFYSSTSIPLNHSRSVMLDPSSDLNHLNTDFPLMPSSLIAANGADTTSSSFDDNTLINNFMPNSPSLSTTSNNTTSLNSNVQSNNLNHNYNSINSSNVTPSSGLSMNAGNSYLNNFNLGLSLDQNIGQSSPSFQQSSNVSSSLSAGNLNTVGQTYHQDASTSQLTDSQSQFSSGVNTRLFNNVGNDYYSSNDIFTHNNYKSTNNTNTHNALSNTDSSLLSNTPMNFLDSDLSSVASNSIPTSAASLPNSASNYYSMNNPLQGNANSLGSVNSFDINHHPIHQQGQQQQPQYDLNNYTPVSRNQPLYNDYSYYAQSLPHQIQFHPPHPSQMSSTQQQLLANNSSYVKRETPDVDFYEPQISETGKKRYRVIRGVSAGGCTTRPPKQSIDSDSIFLPVQLNLHGASVDEICYPKWSIGEKQDRRRIIRIERIQSGPKLIANFSIVGSANDHPVTVPPGPDVDVVEVSCLECSVKPNDDYDSQSSDDEKDGNGMMQSGMGMNYVKGEEDGETHQYYITSVEVVEIVELLIGTQLKDPAERRRERGRVRSNLVPFWSKKSISSRMDSSNYNNGNGSPVPSSPTNQDYRVELAKRIMGYEIRKPRGFDKDVRILRWDKLVPALKRALQSYYTEIPQCDSQLEF